MRALVTGGAGFIGSHLVDALLDLGFEVTAFDRLSTGHLTFLDGPLGNNGTNPNPRFKFVKGDVKDTNKICNAMKDVDLVFHLAANADVRGGIRNTQIDIAENTLGTHSVLEAARINDVERVLFTSSAVVYGEPKVIPTPEEYNGHQTSLYGASKLAAEGLLQAYTTYYNFESYIFRFVSLMGERYTHGVVFDFVKKLFADPKRLEILGDGSQKKSYLYVKDAIQGMVQVMEKKTARRGVAETYNLGNIDTLTAKEVAEIVCDELGLDSVIFSYTGGPRGWIGDSPYVLLDVRKLLRLGWSPSLSTEECVRITASYLANHLQLINRP